MKNVKSQAEWLNNVTKGLEDGSINVEEAKTYSKLASTQARMFADQVKYNKYMRIKDKIKFYHND